MNEENKILGKRLKFLRMEKGISQIHMAKMVGLSQTSLSNMESGKSAIAIQSLFKMRKILKCRMSDFFIDFDDNAVEMVETKKVIELEDVLQI